MAKDFPTLLRAFAVSVATGAPITNTLRPSLTGTVMIYDTESTQDAHEDGLGAMARGFNIDCPTTIYYRHLKGRSLFDVADLLADDVVFHSPVAHTQQLGKVITLQDLSVAFHLFFSMSLFTMLGS